MKTNADKARHIKTFQSQNGTPTPDQLRQINALIPAGFEPLVAEELFVITGAIADNLVNRSFGKWSVRALEQMAGLIPGTPATVDHNWGDVYKVWGRTFEGFIIKTPPEQVEPSYLSAAGNAEYNQEIVNQEGLIRCFASAFTAIDHPIVEMLRMVQVNEISTGGFEFRNVLCPICDTGFEDEKCQHYPPHPWTGRNSKDKREVPYYIRDDLTDIMEWSFVVMPNLPMAGVP